MRHIKIRAWDGKEFLPLAREVAFIDDSGNLRSRIEGIVFSEYTGLKDKNGTEIYEGDIIKFSGYVGSTRYEDPAEVRFGLHYVGYDGGIAGAIALGFYIFPHPDAEDIGVGDSFDWSYTEHSEVIGNIWEDRELLRDKTS